MKGFERSVEVWKDWIRLQKELATLSEELPPAELLPAKRKKHSPDPTKRDASNEEFGRRALAELGTLGEELPPAELLPAKRKKQRPDPTKKDASKEQFG